MRRPSAKASILGVLNPLILFARILQKIGRGVLSMTVRAKTLWRVPVFCTIASWLTYYITIYLGGFFFTVRTQGVDGTVEVSADPVRTAVFTGVLFLAILLAGGLWAFRSMTKAEIACSAAILSAIYLVIILLQLFLPPGGTDGYSSAVPQGEA